MATDIGNIPPSAGGGAATLPSTLILADATTATQPDVLVIRHTTSGTAGTNFGETSAVELQNGSGATKRVMTDVVKYTTVTGGAEAVSRAVSLIIAGALTPVGGWAFAGGSASFPALYVGDPASANGMQKSTAGINFTISATNYMTIDAASGVTFPFRAQHNRGAGIAAATTITLGTGGNTFPVSAGTGTINSIVATSWQSGSRIVLECASGITITNNTAGTGATILTNTGASITTSFTRMIPLTYNGTNWIVEG